MPTIASFCDDIGGLKSALTFYQITTQVIRCAFLSLCTANQSYKYSGVRLSSDYYEQCIPAYRYLPNRQYLARLKTLACFINKLLVLLTVTLTRAPLHRNRNTWRGRSEAALRDGDCLVLSVAKVAMDYLLQVYVRHNLGGRRRITTVEKEIPVFSLISVWIKPPGGAHPEYGLITFCPKLVDHRFRFLV